MFQVPKNNKFRRKKSGKEGRKTPKKEVELIAPTRKLSHEQYIIGVPLLLQVKIKLEEEEAILPPPRKAGERSSSGSRRQGQPHSTPRSCEEGKTKLTTRTPCKTVPSVLGSISTRPYYAGELFVRFLTNQANTPLTLRL